jgi:hypothetical protein
MLEKRADNVVAPERAQAEVGVVVSPEFRAGVETWRHQRPVRRHSDAPPGGAPCAMAEDAAAKAIVDERKTAFASMIPLFGASKRAPMHHTGSRSPADQDACQSRGRSRMVSEAWPCAPQRRQRSARSSSNSRVYAGRSRSSNSWARTARCRQRRQEASTRCQARRSSSEPRISAEIPSSDVQNWVRTPRADRKRHAMCSKRRGGRFVRTMEHRAGLRGPRTNRAGLERDWA